MPVNDRRVFRCETDWWNAIVISSTGYVEDSGRRRMEKEEVVFTCLTKQDEKSRKIYINSGYLNKIKHSAVCSLLQQAEVVNERSSYSIASPPEVENGTGIQYTDENGIRWLLRESRVTRILSEKFTERSEIPAVSVYCIDDSAIKGRVPMADDFTFFEFCKKYGEVAYNEIIDIVEMEYFKLEDAEPQKTPRRPSSRNLKSQLKLDPIGAIMSAKKVRYGNLKTHIATPTIYAIRSIRYKGNVHSVEAGIYAGKVYAATCARNETLELAIISAIENNPEHVFILDEFRRELKELE